MKLSAKGRPNPREAAALDEARALHEAGAHDLAEPLYRAVLARTPDSAEALRLLGLLLHQTGRGAEALDQVRRAAGLRANDWAVQDLLGVVLKALGQLDPAIEAFGRAVALEPAAFGPRYNLGNALHASGRSLEAIACYRRAVRADPANAWVWNNLADAYIETDATADAIPCYRAATRLSPDVAEFHFNLAQAHRAVDDWPAADSAYNAASERAPGNVVMLHHRALAKQRLGDMAAAAASLAEVVRLQPEDPGPISNLGLVLQELGRFGQAEHWLTEVVRLKPGSAAALTNLGNAMGDQGRLQEAEALHREALRLEPDYVGARYNLCLTLLAQGRLAEGFAEYHARWAALGFTPRFAGDPWTGEPATGRRLAVHYEQGIGDFLQFCRLVPAAAARASVSLIVPRLLHRLLDNQLVFADIRIEDDTRYQTDSDAGAPGFDLHCSLIDLPHALGLSEATIPPAPYLAADPVLTAAWRQRLAALPGRRVGLVWAGNPGYANDRARSLPFDALAPLAGLEGVSFVSVQKGGAPWTQRSPDQLPGLRLHDWTDELGDFADTAALVGALDLLISVDTSVAHLAGAIGAPVWLLNRADTDWRWRHHGTTTPWYPSMRIFRQAVPRDWVSVLADVRAALTAESPE